MTGWKHTNFPEVAKVQRFGLTLTSEARLWYESLRPIVVDCIGLWECFRQQYSNLVIHESNYSVCYVKFFPYRLISNW